MQYLIVRVGVVEEYLLFQPFHKRTCIGSLQAAEQVDIQDVQECLCDLLIVFIGIFPMHLLDEREKISTVGIVDDERFAGCRVKGFHLKEHVFVPFGRNVIVLHKRRLTDNGSRREGKLHPVRHIDAVPFGIVSDLPVPMMVCLICVYRAVLNAHNNMEKTQNLSNKILEMDKANYSWLEAADLTKEFTDGTSLFYIYFSSYLSQLRTSDLEFGILPYPMYDEAQDGDYSLSWNGQLAVPSSVKNTEMVGEILEMLNYFSPPVTEAYYERLLGSKVANAPDDAEMPDVIWASQISDPGVTFASVHVSMNQLVFLNYNLMDNTKAISSFITSHTRQAQRGLDDLTKDHG